jgi:NAD(P)-dependent dehydrogenase (short-subunit alcohol dehydrogenase family)
MAKKRAALVTGASYGVGAATARSLAHDGFDIAVTATRIENLADTVTMLEPLGARVVPVALDLRSETEIARAAADVIAALGGLDLLVNNAGVNLRKLAADVSREDWDVAMAVNVRGTFFLTQQVGRHLIATGRGGCIVSIASTHALVGAPERSTYGISKAALVGMTRMLAVEWAGHGIRVNAIAPGRTHPRRRERTRAPSANTWRQCSSAFRCAAKRPRTRWRRRWRISRAPPRRRSPDRFWCLMEG